MVINVSNEDIIRITFTLENTGTVTTNYYIYFIFNSPGEPTITYPAFRQELTPGEIRTIDPTLAVENFVAGKDRSTRQLDEFCGGGAASGADKKSSGI